MYICKSDSNLSDGDIHVSQTNLQHKKKQREEKNRRKEKNEMKTKIRSYIDKQIINRSFLIHKASKTTERSPQELIPPRKLSAFLLLSFYCDGVEEVRTEDSAREENSIFPL